MNKHKKCIRLNYVRILTWGSVPLGLNADMLMAQVNYDESLKQIIIKLNHAVNSLNVDTVHTATDEPLCIARKHLLSEILRQFVGDFPYLWKSQREQLIINDFKTNGHIIKHGNAL